MAQRDPVSPICSLPLIPASGFPPLQSQWSSGPEIHITLANRTGASQFVLQADMLSEEQMADVSLPIPGPVSQFG